MLNLNLKYRLRGFDTLRGELFFLEEKCFEWGIQNTLPMQMDRDLISVQFCLYLIQEKNTSPIDFNRHLFYNSLCAKLFRFFKNSTNPKRGNFQ